MNYVYTLMTKRHKGTEERPITYFTSKSCKASLC